MLCPNYKKIFKHFPSLYLKTILSTQSVEILLSAMSNLTPDRKEVLYSFNSKFSGSRVFTKHLTFREGSKYHYQSMTS